jgi:hypothetical protein
MVFTLKSSFFRCTCGLCAHDSSAGVKGVGAGNEVVTLRIAQEMRASGTGNPGSGKTTLAEQGLHLRTTDGASLRSSSATLRC